MRKIILFGAIIVLASQLMAKDFGNGDLGTTGASFLNFGAGARAIAMGGAYSAISDDASAVFWNPAGLAQGPKYSMLFMHSEYLADITFDHVSFAHSNGKSGFAAALGYMNGGEMDHTDNSGNNIGSYQPRDYSATLSYANSFNDGAYSFGINAKFLKSSIIEKAETYAFDLGFISKHNLPIGKLKLAFVAQNIGHEIKFDKEGDPLPLTFKLGGALNISNWLISSELVASKAHNIYGIIGAETKAMRVSNDSDINLRLGLNTMNLSDISKFSGLTGGFGINISNMSVD